MRKTGRAEAKIFEVFVTGGGLESIVERALANYVAKLVDDLVFVAESAGLSETEARATLRRCVRKACRALGGV